MSNELMSNLKSYIKNYQLNSGRCWSCNAAANCSQSCSDSGGGSTNGCGCVCVSCNSDCAGCDSQS